MSKDLKSKMSDPCNGLSETASNTVGFSTKSIHATLPRDAYDASTSLSPPIMTASTYRTPVDYVLDSGTHKYDNRTVLSSFSQKYPSIYLHLSILKLGNDYVYGRYGNPSRNGLEAVVAAMEGAQHALIFSSGEVLFFPLSRNCTPQNYLSSFIF